MWIGTCHHMVMATLIISTIQYPFVEGHDSKTAIYSSENNIKDGIPPYSEDAGQEIVKVVPLPEESSQPRGKREVCNYPEEIKKILQGTSPSYGPGWVSLTWSTSGLCNPLNFKGLPLDSVRLEISGGRRKNPTSWELSVADNDEWHEGNLTLNFTNGSKNCTSDWCWEPCTRYSLKIVPVVKDRQSVMDFENIYGNLNIRTLIDDVTRDAKVQDFRVVERGSEWLLLRWKVPYCLPDDGKKYTAVLYNSQKWKVCPEDLNRSVISINSTGEYYHSYNMTKCDFITFTPCTEYKIRIRGEFGPAKLSGPEPHKNLKSEDLKARTLPHPIANLAFNQTPSAITLKLTWSQAPLCVSYPLSQYRLSVKADSKTFSGFSKTISTKCGKDTCEEEVEVLPCTKYEAKLTPVYDKYNDDIPPVTASYYTSFPDNETSIPKAFIEARGANWILLNWTTPTCTRDLKEDQAYSIKLYKKVNVQTPSFTTIRYTQLNATSKHGHTTQFQNVSVEPCAEYYFEIKALYTVHALDAKANWTRSNVIRTLLDRTNNYIRDLKILDVESTPVRFTWQPPPCTNLITGYRFLLQENFNVTKSTVVDVKVPVTCVNKDNELYWPPVPECGNQIKAGALEPCTEYTLEVWPLAENESGSNIYVSRNITFTKNPARLGKLDLVQLTGSNETTLTIAWRNITQNSRCLKHYEISATNRIGRKLPLPFVTAGNSYTFTNLNPCTTYQVSVKATGKAKVDFYEEINEYSTKEPSLGPPQNLKCSLMLPTSLNLTWSAPEKHPQCVKEYRIHISEVDTNSTQSVFRDLTTTSTNVHIPDLKPKTTYQFRVTACTNTQSSVNTQAILYITTLHEPEIASPLSITIVVVLVVAGTVIFLTLIFCCYLKKCSLNSSQTKRCPSDRRVQSDYVSTKFRADDVIKMQNLALSRPIPVEGFDNIFNELTENTPTFLSEQFADLTRFCNETLPKTVESKAENKVKKCSVDTIPDDQSRIHRNPTPEDEHEDYINVSFVQGFNGAREYIASQGPKDLTVPAFWRMIWERGVRIVVMVMHAEGKGKTKCVRYWPDSKQVVTYGDIKVTQVLHVNVDDYVILDLEVEHKGMKRVIKHMNCPTWPDFGCPQNPETTVSIIEAMRDALLSLSASGPILVHCSAGVGRTGTFIAIDWLIQEARVSSHLDVFSTVLKLRSDCVKMVQTEEQYRFIHECLSHFLKTRVREPSPIYAIVRESPSYVNVDQSQLYENVRQSPLYANVSQGAVKKN